MKGLSVRHRIFPSFAVAAVAVLSVSGLAAASTSHVAATTNLTNCRFSANQVFGGMSNLTATRLYASDFQPPFADHLHRTLNSSDLASTDYFAFVPLAANHWALNLYKGSGALKRTIDSTGVFLAVGTDFYYYNGDGSFRTVISTRQGYLSGDAKNWPIAFRNPTSSILNGMNNCSATPLAGGETLNNAHGTTSTTMHVTTTTSHVTTTTGGSHVTTTTMAPATTTTSQLAHTGLKTDIALGSAMWLVAFGMLLMLATQLRRRRAN